MTQASEWDRFVGVILDTETGEVDPRRQLVELARRFPDGFVEKIEGNDYVAHHIVTQRLLSVVGPFDFELVQVIRSDLPAVPGNPNGKSRRAKEGTPPLRDAVTGGIWRLTCEVDGRRVRVEEVGDCDPHNNATDGARLKDAASDALKRCAMRLGLGLHLWAQEFYFLDRQLAKATAVAERPVDRGPSDPVPPPTGQQARVGQARQRPAWAADGTGGEPGRA